jgi:hypothetical protein
VRDSAGASNCSISGAFRALLHDRRDDDQEAGAHGLAASALDRLGIGAGLENSARSPRRSRALPRDEEIFHGRSAP